MFFAQCLPLPKITPGVRTCWIALVLVACGSVSCGHSAESAENAELAIVSIEQQAWQRITAGALIIDVRSHGEYNGGHLDNALCIPFHGIIEEVRKRAIATDTSIVLYCHSGGRADVALAALKKAGYTQLLNGRSYRALIDAKPSE